jgi:NtrC-family two-component system sensor histidine kinase KinB
MVDPAQLERIVENLVVNAVKHTEPGTHIWIRAWMSDEGLELSVEDAGAGVPDELKSIVFEPFKQGKKSSATGTGIGLSLVQEFARLHGGGAWVEDRPGGGATFRVTLPAEYTSFSIAG